MKTFILLVSIFMISACSTTKNERSLASSNIHEIFATTNIVQNNGHKGTKCEFVSVTEEVAGEERLRAYLKLHFEGKEVYSLFLFDILEDGTPATLWAYGGEAHRPQPKHTYVRVNQKAPKNPRGNTDTGLTMTKSQIKQESDSSYDRYSFTLKFRDGDYKNISYIEWHLGPSMLNRMWLAPASLIFHNDWKGNDGHCDFR